MIDLYGWDTASLAKIDLVNEALKRSGNQLITEFGFNEDGVHIEGRFAPWQIAPGGGGQRLNMTLPIISGQIKGGLGSVKLAGVILELRVILRLLDPPDAPDERHLVFDFDSTFSDERSVEPIKVTDPSGHLSDLQKRALVKAAAMSLSSHSGQVSFVFASVKVRGTTDADTLFTTNHDWIVVSIIDGPQYLAILGAMKRPAKGASAIDTQLISDHPSAVLAVGANLLASRFLQPALQSSFRPKARFSVKGSTVYNAHPIHLERLQKGIYKIDPVVKTLTLAPETNYLRCKVKVDAPLPLLATFHTNIDMKMPVTFDEKTGKLVIRPDTNPKETHTIDFPKWLDWLIGWFVRWIMSWFKEEISSALKAISMAFQRFNSPNIDTVQWRGIRDFKIGNVELKTTLAIKDVRKAK